MSEDYPVFTMALLEAMFGGDDAVEIHSKKYAFEVARAWGELPEYRRRRLEIRHAEKARREALKRRNG